MHNLAAEGRFDSHSFRIGIELRSYIKPELGELQVGLAHFVHVRVARPFETLFGHDTVVRSRFHGIALCCVAGCAHINSATNARAWNAALAKRKPQCPHIGA